MQDLPIFEAVAEVIQAILLSFTPDVTTTTIGVDIKAKKKLHNDHESDCQVFYIRVSSSRELNLHKCFGDDVLRRLKEVLLYMQSGDDEGHLSVQRPYTANTPGCVQEVFWLDSGDNGDITLKCQHSINVPSVDAPELSPFVIHFRVVQKESHIVSVGHRIHKFLHKMKLLNQKAETTFSMKVCGAVCQTDFSVKKYFSVKDVSVVDDIKYFFGKGCLKSLWCGTVKAFTGRNVSVPVSEQQTPSHLSQVSVSTLTCLYPLTERYPKTTGMPGITGNIVINFYGPDLVPLILSTVHLKDLIVDDLMDWEQFSLSLKGTGLMNHGDVSVAATLTNLRYLPPWAFGSTSFLLCLAVVFVDCHEEQDSARCFDIIKYLQDDLRPLKHLRPTIGESMSSSLRHIFFHRETEHEKLYRKTYLQCIEMVSSSMCDIFNHSTNIDFRNNMTRLLQVGNKEEMRAELKESLTRIANVPENKNLETDSVENDNEIDVWEEDHLTGKRRQGRICTGTDPAILSQQSSIGDPLDVDSDGAELDIQDTEQEMLSDVQELNDFDDSIRSRTHNSWNPVADQGSFHIIQEEANSETDFLTEPGHIQPDPDVLGEELELFSDYSGLDVQHSLVEASQEVMDSADSTNHTQVPTSTELLTEPHIGNHRPLSSNTATGDEWLNDVMFDVANWI